MSKEDIEKAVKEAEQYAAEDAKIKEKVEVRNQADQMVYQSEKAIEEMKDKLDAAEISELEAEVNKVKEALKGTDNSDEVKAAMDDLNTKASAMGQAMYAAAQAKQQADEAQAPTAGAEDASSSPADDDVVDAEIVDDEDNDKK